MDQKNHSFWSYCLLRNFNTEYPRKKIQTFDHITVLKAALFIMAKMLKQPKCSLTDK